MDDQPPAFQPDSQLEFPEGPDRRWRQGKPQDDPNWHHISHPRFQGIAEAKGYDQSYSRIAKTRYSHDAVIDYIIANPRARGPEIAKEFGYTSPWVSRVIGSDAFQAALAKRRSEVTDPYLIATVEEKLSGLAHQSLEILAEKLSLPTANADMALKALDLSTKALGFGARANLGGNVQNNFVVQLPMKAASAEEWVDSFVPARLASPVPLSTTINRDPTRAVDPSKLAEE